MTSLEGAIGFCRKAGKLTYGSHDVIEKMRAGKIAIVLVSCDTGKSSLGKISKSCDINKVPLEVISLTKSQMAKVAGLEREVGVMGIPSEFREMVLKAL